MNTNRTRTTRSPPSPKVSQKGYPGRQHTCALVSEQPSNTARYSNASTTVPPSLSVEGNDDSFALEDISAQDPGYDGDVEVLAPYEYEEAESRPSTPQRTKNGAINDDETDDLGKAGLIDAMRALDCDSDITDYGNHRLRIRKGRKRKGRPLFSGKSTPDCSADTGYIEIIDLERGGRVFTPIKPRKRRRRRAYTGDTSDSHNVEKSSVDWGSSTHVPRGINLNETAFPPQGDKMDIG
ncbi:hypothetical protein EMCG_08357 [[Emmonsia] crescens]|uniref:Uncharacterized protein n=1 Tax=[Emmonsia] crescens TaxID=73230 RepID=A0A0G2I5G1_9EURO|nr:hypothetical protein EMCG_08357 [Emmonsia crescens UAMH 3008]